MEFFNRLSSREQNIVIWAGSILFCILLFLIVIEPIQNKLKDAELRLESEKILLEYMSKSAIQLVNKGSINNAGLNNHKNTTPFILLDQNIKRIGLAMPNKMTPKGQKGISFRYESVPFDQLIQLIQNLQEQGLYLKQLNTEKIAKGMVSCRVRLTKP